MCRVLGVAPSGYYAWLLRPHSNRAMEDARLLRLIRASFTASNGVYGAPRVFLNFREAGETCSKHRVERLMHENGRRALHGYRTRRWVIGKPAVLIPNLLKRRFTATRPNAAWATDITYVRTSQGWLYLADVLDLFSRKVVGWAAGPTVHRKLVLNAVLPAVQQRRPRGTWIQSVVATPHFLEAAMAVSKKRSANQSLRAKLRSPGRPSVGRREDRQRFWAAIARGQYPAAAVADARVSWVVGARWLRQARGMPPSHVAPSAPPLSGRHLSFAEREHLALLRAQ